MQKEFKIPAKIAKSLDGMVEQYNAHVKKLQEEHKEYFEKLERLNQSLSMPMNMLIRGYLSDKDVPEDYTFEIKDETIVVTERKVEEAPANGAEEAEVVEAKSE